MPIYNAGSRIAAGAANVLERLNQDEKDRPRVEAQNAAFRHQQALSEAQNTPANINAQVEALQAQNQTIANKQAKQATYDALRLYSSDFKVSHLNDLLQEEPSVRKVWGNASSIQKIDPVADVAILRRAGVSTDMPSGPRGGAGDIDNRFVQFNPNRHVKTIDAQGNENVADMTKVMGGTGFLNQLRDEELDYLIKRAKLFGEPDKGYAPGETQKKIDTYAEHGVEGGDKSLIAQGLYDDTVAGNAAGQLRMAEDIETELLASFEEDGGYYNADMSLHKNRVKASHAIRSIEKLADVKFSATDRADLKDINVLIKTGDVAVKDLTPDVVGAFDNTYKRAKDYLFDNVDEVDETAARSAYAAFRNTVRHSLFGSALTPGEIKAFTEAFGSLNQKYPAVMTQFKTALIQTKAKLETIYETNDPVLAHYYFGQSRDKLETIIREIDNRLELFEKTGGDQITPTPPEIKQSTDSYESILGPRTVEPTETVQ